MKTFSFRLLLFLSLAALSCKDNKVDDPNSIEMVERTLARDERPVWEKDISLDNGDQWHANPETTQGIMEMTGLVEDFESDSLQDYRTLAEALADRKDEIIRQCTMKGASHNNLHVYLQPLIVKIAELEQVKSTAAGERILAEIQYHLKAYHRYFV